MMVWAAAERVLWREEKQRRVEHFQGRRLVVACIFIVGGGAVKRRYVMWKSLKALLCVLFGVFDEF